MITLMLQIICLWVRKVMIGVHYHFPGSLHFVAWTHFTQCCELHYTLHSTHGQNMRILPRTNCVERSPCSQFAHKRTLQYTEAAPGPSAPASLYTSASHLLSSPFFAIICSRAKLELFIDPCVHFSGKGQSFFGSAEFYVLSIIEGPIYVSKTRSWSEVHGLTTKRQG